MAWTRITDPGDATDMLPSWLVSRLCARRGRFGLLLTTGDVLRVTSIVAVLLSPEGHLLLDVALDSAGVPDGVDLAWQTKHFLGAPYPGAEEATVNLSQVVTAIEFTEIAHVEPPNEIAAPAPDEVIADLNRLTEQAALRRPEEEPADAA